MKTIETECTNCGASAGEQCRSYGTERRNKSGFHVSRASRARYLTVADRVIKNRHNKALDERRKARG
jgi:hypothetical protein